MENVRISDKSLIKNGWTSNGGSYSKVYGPVKFRIFLSKDYGVDGNYMIKFQHDLSTHSPQININCLTIQDLQSLQGVFYRAAALDLMKEVLSNY